MAKKTTTDAQIQTLIDEIAKRKAEITKLNRPDYRTNMSFSYHGDVARDPINLQIKADVQELVMIASFIQLRCDAYDQMNTTLEAKAPIFRWCGYTIDDWLYDIKMKINKIQINTKQKTLEVLENRLNSIISPEMKRQLELDAITKELQN